MKVFFLKDHSLYKIFKTLEKIPRGKSIEIIIEAEHALFENERRGKQIKELLEKRELDAVFITKSEKPKRFFTSLWLKVEHKQKHTIFKALHLAYLFFFHIKKFHLHAVEKRNYIFYIIFGIEFVFVIGVIYMLYALIIPSATLHITPNYIVEDITYNFRYYPADEIQYPEYSRYLNVPFYSGHLDYKYQMTISASNIQYIQSPSSWSVRIYNTTQDELALVENTRFVTEDWRLFRAPQRFTIPAKSGNVIGEVIIPLQAAEYDEQGAIMGTRGNITNGEKLYIRNLNRSYFTKEIYAETIGDFIWWNQQSTGFVTSGDYQILRDKLQSYIESNAVNLTIQNFSLPESVLLRFPELMEYEIQNIEVLNNEGTSEEFLKWSVTARFYFTYLKRKDIDSTILAHTNQRQSEKTSIIDIDKNSLTFFDNIDQRDNIYIIPTKVSIIQWYDFDNDINQVLPSIKSRIVGKRYDEARSIILDYEEISTVRINVRPPRYSSIPKIKSRINTRIVTP